ncbi:MAG: reverse transcriptase family protein [Oscillospiraceae bacterium]
MVVYTEIGTLERELGFKAKTLYAVSHNLSGHYREVELKKADGGIRRFSVPDGLLKSIQRSINTQLLAREPVSQYATAYRVCASTIRNAAPHCGHRMLLKLDIHSFFDSVLYSAVKERAFPEGVFSEPLRVLLTNLCYFRDGLPQGAPTSPAIANIVMRDFDGRVGDWCGERGIIYTRYCDDMAFSGDFSPWEVRRFVEYELRWEGYFLNYKKTHAAPQASRQCVTGLVVNESVSVPREYRRQLRQEIYYARRYGVEEHIKRSGAAGTPQEYLRRLIGRLDYVLGVSPDNDEMRLARDWARAELKRRSL